MDDYILKVLLEQQDGTQEHSGEQVRRRLEEYLVSGENGMTNGQKTEEPSEHNGPGRGTGENEKEKDTGAWKGQQRTRTLERVLEGIRQSEELQTRQQVEIKDGAAYLEQVGLWREILATGRINGGTGETTGTAFGANGQGWQTMEPERGQNAMEPERLSMFFQRDARRYS